VRQGGVAVTAQSNSHARWWFLLLLLLLVLLLLLQRRHALLTRAVVGVAPGRRPRVTVQIRESLGAPGVAVQVEFENKTLNPVFHSSMIGSRVETRRSQAMGQLDWIQPVQSHQGVESSHRVANRRRQVLHKCARRVCLDVAVQQVAFWKANFETRVYTVY
jgi:MYXO-CTERM domain-containing protein